MKKSKMNHIFKGALTVGTVFGGSAMISDLDVVYAAAQDELLENEDKIDDVDAVLPAENLDGEADVVQQDDTSSEPGPVESNVESTEEGGEPGPGEGGVEPAEDGEEPGPGEGDIEPAEDGEESGPDESNVEPAEDSEKLDLDEDDNIQGDP